MPPLVSICLPSLNTMPFLEERMETILAQTRGDWELIVCDSYSDDGSWEFFQQFKGDSRIRLHQVPREGLYAGWNECLRRARGEYVYFATSDDTASPVILEALLSPLEDSRSIDIAVCDFLEIDKNGHPLPVPPRPQHIFFGPWMDTPSIRNGKTEFLLHCAFGTTIWVTMASVLFRRNLLNRIGFFRTDLGSKADEEWALRAALASDIAFVPGKLATWRRYPGQATKQWQPRQTAQVLLNCIEAVIKDSDSGIPDAWKKVHGWQALLTAHHRHRYDRSFNLYRYEARSHPSAFAHDAWEAFWKAPKWFWSQTLRAYSLPQDGEFDAASHALRLIDAFDADWPPRRREA